MRWGQIAKTNPDTYYSGQNKFWFAWYPVRAVVAEATAFEDEVLIWVWWEYVKVERFVASGHDTYGFVCQSTVYRFELVERDELPSHLRTQTKREGHAHAVVLEMGDERAKARPLTTQKDMNNET